MSIALRPDPVWNQFLSDYEQKCAKTKERALGVCLEIEGREIKEDELEGRKTTSGPSYGNTYQMLRKNTILSALQVSVVIDIFAFNPEGRNNYLWDTAFLTLNTMQLRSKSITNRLRIDKVTFLGTEKERTNAIAHIEKIFSEMGLVSLVADYLPILKQEAGLFLQDPESCWLGYNDQYGDSQSTQLRVYQERDRDDDDEDLVNGPV